MTSPRVGYSSLGNPNMSSIPPVVLPHSSHSFHRSHACSLLDPSVDSSSHKLEDYGSMNYNPFRSYAQPLLHPCHGVGPCRSLTFTLATPSHHSDFHSPRQYPMSIVNFAPLNGVNYKKWKEDIELNLGILDYDHVLREDPPAEPANDASREVKAKYQEWHKHNRIALIYMKKCMTDAVKGGIPNSDLAKVYFASIGDKYRVSDKAETGYLMNKLIRMSYNGQGSVREYILQN
ncbi:hypothetical protein OSB04_006437 [Centaurea solstitialis]|uniref:Retrotransposon Copia-like N-terminal domain-containing protein n=1 Tax=Centaurea solstitialis TaxID=347529 RepID=A0AA38WHG5_9ASTR|nr:hypothetical protein OSB04_006437 [Centaurea solstitialis]